MKKRNFLFVALIACLCLTAIFGTTTVNASATSSAGITEEQYIEYAEGLLSEIVAMDDAAINTYLASGSLSEGLAAGLTSWQTEGDELGAFVEVMDATVTMDDEEVTIVVSAKFEKREGSFTITMAADGSSVSTSGFEKKLTLGEIFKKAALNTLIGMGTVFCVLIFISFIISLFKYIPEIQAKFTKKPEKAVEAPKAPAPAAVPVVEQEEEQVDDGELVAVITAALYAAMASEGKAVSKDGLVVRSIRRSRRK